MNNNIINKGLSLIVVGAIISLLVLILFYFYNLLAIELIGVGLILIGAGLYLSRPKKKEIIHLEDKNTNSYYKN